MGTYAELSMRVHALEQAVISLRNELEAAKPPPSQPPRFTLRQTDDYDWVVMDGDKEVYGARTKAEAEAWIQGRMSAEKP